MERQQVEESYDAVAGAYADRFRHEMDHKPFDRYWLDRFAALTRDLGRVCDIGCGPGQVARYLHERGADVFGADLSEEMLRHARRLNPDVEFRRLDMLELSLPPASLGGIVAF